VPVPLERQVAILYIATKGLLDDIPTPRVRDFEAQFVRFLDTQRTDVMKKLSTTKVLDDDTAAALEAAAVEFRQTFLA
jgi:F-type H+-transporting ATPase subunit alpha